MTESIDTNNVEPKKAEIKIISEEPQRVGEFWFDDPNKKVGVWTFPRLEGAWHIGLEVFIAYGYDEEHARQRLSSFVSSNKDIRRLPDIFIVMD